LESLAKKSELSSQKHIKINRLQAQFASHCEQQVPSSLALLSTYQVEFPSTNRHGSRRQFWWIQDRQAHRNQQQHLEAVDRIVLAFHELDEFVFNFGANNLQDAAAADEFKKRITRPKRLSVLYLVRLKLTSEVKT
jgi:hypothetical protein